MMKIVWTDWQWRNNDSSKNHQWTQELTEDNSELHSRRGSGQTLHLYTLTHNDWSNSRVSPLYADNNRAFVRYFELFFQFSFRFFFSPFFWNTNGPVMITTRARQHEAQTRGLVTRECAASTRPTDAYFSCTNNVTVYYKRHYCCVSRWIIVSPVLFL